MPWMHARNKNRTDHSEEGLEPRRTLLSINGTRPAIDYGPIENNIGYALRRAQIAVFQDFFAGFAKVDIRPAQYSVLTIIERNPGLSQSQVAEALGIKKANFVAMVDTLEARGLIRRVPTTNDRRSYGLFLTPSGKRIILTLHNIAAMHERRITQRVGPNQLRDLLAALRVITDMATDRGKKVRP
jgi:DNA-binding MarR family transcriptional regulator